MKTDYTPTTEEVKGAYHKHRYYSDPRFRYSLGSLEEFDRWLSELIRKEREEAWVEGVNASDTQYEHIFNGHPVPEGEMCGECGMLSKNPYSNGSNEI